MTPDSITPNDLIEAPELAALAMISAAADIGTRALFAAHPALASSDFFVEQPDATAQQCLAVTVLHTMEALEDAVGHYVAHVKARAEWRTNHLGDQSESDF